mgnify:CR=1 FL=1
MDDLNFLLFREQEELLRAAQCRNRDKRERHLAVAETYARRIIAHRLPYRSHLAGGGAAVSPS